ncbi:hypothetical protein LTR28_006558, partial [Elasticomyces elasticus]
VTDPPLPQTHFFNIWGYTIDQLGEAWGKTFRIWSQSKDILEGLGFVDVVEKRYRWPLNPWSKDKRMKEIGFWNRQRTLEGMEGFMLRLLTNTGNAIEKAQVFLAEMRMALKDKSTQAWLDVTGQCKDQQTFQDPDNLWRSAPSYASPKRKRRRATSHHPTCPAQQIPKNTSQDLQHAAAHWARATSELAASLARI